MRRFERLVALHRGAFLAGAFVGFLALLLSLSALLALWGVLR